MASAKSMDPQSWNRYVYMGNNPMVFADPSGMERGHSQFHGNQAEIDHARGVGQAEVEEQETYYEDRLAGKYDDIVETVEPVDGALEQGQEQASIGLAESTLPSPQNPVASASVALTDATLGAPQEAGTIQFEPGQVYLCTRLTQINGVFSFVNSVASHFWLRTDEKEAGLGPLGGGVPGQNAGPDSPYVSETSINNHQGESKKTGVSCEKVRGADPAIVNRELQIGKRMGLFTATNNCFTFVNRVIWKARGNDKRNPYWDAIEYGPGIP